MGRKCWGDRAAVLARELTKTHEELIRGALSHIREELAQRSAIKGEITLLVGGYAASAPDAEGDDFREMLRRALAESDVSPSRIAKQVAGASGVPRKTVYAEILKMQKQDVDKA